MKLYGIISKDKWPTSNSEKSIQAACKQRGLEYVRLVAEDVALNDLAGMTFDEPALLYRLSLGAKATAIETLLSILHANKLTTIYYPRTIVTPSISYQELANQIKAGLNIIPTVILDDTWRHKTADQLETDLRALGGFPIVIKTLGLSHGQGVSKVDSADDLRTMLKTINFNECHTIARKYLADYRHYRFIILNGAVAATIEYHKPSDDFRTNASGNPDVSSVSNTELSQECIDLAIKAVELHSSILGGVDILVESSTNVPYLAEVNVPCNFSRAELPTGIDIGGALVDALIDKSKGATS